MSDWHVLTAGPSAGKSSTLRELSARGYRTAPEAARIVADQLTSEGVNPKDFREAKPQEFQDRVIETDRRIQQKLPNRGPVFMDRSIYDNIAYTNLTDRELPEILDRPESTQFGLVFLLDRIEFQEDGVRTEDESFAAMIHEELRDVYEDYGFEVVDVPVMPVDERADFIERKIERIAIH